MAAPVLQFKRGLLANLPGLRAGEPGFTTDSYDLYVGIDSTSNNNKFFGSHRYWSKETTAKGSGVNLVEGTTNGTQFITLKSPDSLSGITTYTFPATPTADYFLKTNASGDLSWAAVTLNSFAGIVTFTDTTDNTLGNENTGSVQFDGGVGIAKNLTVKQNLHVGGYSEFVGVATFKGGTINLGDGTDDDINVGGEFISGLFPNTTATYDLGDGSRQWRHGNFSGIVTASSGAVIDGVQIGINGANVIDTVSGNLTLNSAGGQTIIDDAVRIQNNLTIDGNLSIGGTTVFLTSEDVFIRSKDIVLGYTTNTSNADVSTDVTANHAGVAIASTEGSPLVSFTASGINTLPDTYKQMMWFKSGTLGFATDAFGFNYGVAIGTTTMADGIRLAVGTGITMTDTAINASGSVRTPLFNSSNLTLQAPTIGNFAGERIRLYDFNSLSNTNYAVGVETNHVWFGVDNYGESQGFKWYGEETQVMRLSGVGNLTLAGNLDASSGIATFSGLNVTGNTTLGDTSGDTITVKGTATFEQTITGTATTATRAQLIDTANTTNNTDYYVTFVDTLAGQNGETLRTGIGLSVNPSTGNVGVASVLSVGNINDVNAFIKAGGGSNALYLYSNGDVSFQAKAIVNEIRSASSATTLITLSGLDATFAQNVKVTGITTTGTLVLNGTPGIGITGVSSSTTLAENSNDYLPTQAAVKAYVDAVDVTTGIAGDTGTGSVSTSQTLTVAGTAGEIETSASGQTITVGLPDTVIVGTALSTPTVRTATLQHRNGTQAATIDTSGNITASQDLTISGNLYVNGSTTQVNTASMTVEDRTIELGVVNGNAPSSTTTWDLGVLFNYYDGSAKKSALIWEQSAARFKLGSVVSDGGGTDNDSPQITFTTYAALELGELWINNTCTGGSSQVIACSGDTLVLQNITIDGGSFS